MAAATTTIRPINVAYTSFSSPIKSSDLNSSWLKFWQKIGNIGGVGNHSHVYFSTAEKKVLEPGAAEFEILEFENRAPSSSQPEMAAATSGAVDLAIVEPIESAQPITVKVSAFEQDKPYEAGIKLLVQRFQAAKCPLSAHTVYDVSEAQQVDATIESRRLRENVADDVEHCSGHKGHRHEDKINKKHGFFTRHLLTRRLENKAIRADNIVKDAAKQTLKGIQKLRQFIKPADATSKGVELVSMQQMKQIARSEYKIAIANDQQMSLGAAFQPTLVAEAKKQGVEKLFTGGLPLDQQLRANAKAQGGLEIKQINGIAAVVKSLCDLTEQTPAIAALYQKIKFAASLAKSSPTQIDELINLFSQLYNQKMIVSTRGEDNAALVYNHILSQIPLGHDLNSILQNAEQERIDQMRNAMDIYNKDGKLIKRGNIVEFDLQGTEVVERLDSKANPVWMKAKCEKLPKSLSVDGKSHPEGMMITQQMKNGEHVVTMRYNEAKKKVDYTLTLKTFNKEGKLEEKIIPITSRLVGSPIPEELYGYFSESIVDKLKQSGTHDFNRLFGNLRAEAYIQHKVMQYVHQDIAAEVERVLTKEDIQTIRGTGYDPNAAFVGEAFHHGVRRSVMGVLVEKFLEGRVAGDGYCGFQQNIGMAMGASMCAYLDFQHKAYRANPHGNDPYAVEEKRTYSEVLDYTASAGVYEKSIGVRGTKGKYAEASERLVQEGRNIKRNESDFSATPIVEVRPLYKADTELSPTGHRQLRLDENGHATRTKLSDDQLHVWKKRELVPLAITVLDAQGNERSHLVRGPDGQPVMIPEGMKLTAVKRKGEEKTREVKTITAADLYTVDERTGKTTINIEQFIFERRVEKLEHQVSVLERRDANGNVTLLAAKDDEVIDGKTVADETGNAVTVTHRFVFSPDEKDIGYKQKEKIPSFEDGVVKYGDGKEKLTRLPHFKLEVEGSFRWQAVPIQIRTQVDPSKIGTDSDELLDMRKGDDVAQPPVPNNLGAWEEVNGVMVDQANACIHLLRGALAENSDACIRQELMQISEKLQQLDQELQQPDLLPEKRAQLEKEYQASQTILFVLMGELSEPGKPMEKEKVEQVLKNFLQEYYRVGGLFKRDFTDLTADLVVGYVKQDLTEWWDLAEKKVVPINCVHSQQLDSRSKAADPRMQFTGRSHKPGMKSESFAPGDAMLLHSEAEGTRHQYIQQQGLSREGTVLENAELSRGQGAVVTSAQGHGDMYRHEMGLQYDEDGLIVREKNKHTGELEFVHREATPYTQETHKTPTHKRHEGNRPDNTWVFKSGQIRRDQRALEQELENKVESLKPKVEAKIKAEEAKEKAAGAKIVQADPRLSPKYMAEKKVGLGPKKFGLTVAEAELDEVVKAIAERESRILARQIEPLVPWKKAELKSLQEEQDKLAAQPIREPAHVKKISAETVEEKKTRQIIEQIELLQQQLQEQDSAQGSSESEGSSPLNTSSRSASQTSMDTVVHYPLASTSSFEQLSPSERSSLSSSAPQVHPGVAILTSVAHSLAGIINTDDATKAVLNTLISTHSGSLDPRSNDNIMIALLQDALEPKPENRNKRLSIIIKNLNQLKNKPDLSQLKAQVEELLTKVGQHVDQKNLIEQTENRALLELKFRPENNDSNRMGLAWKTGVGVPGVVSQTLITANIAMGAQHAALATSLCTAGLVLMGIGAEAAITGIDQLRRLNRLEDDLKPLQNQVKALKKVVTGNTAAVASLHRELQKLEDFMGYLKDQSEGHRQAGQIEHYQLQPHDVESLNQMFTAITSKVNDLLADKTISEKQVDALRECAVGLHQQAGKFITQSEALEKAFTPMLDEIGALLALDRLTQAQQKTLTQLQARLDNQLKAIGRGKSEQIASATINGIGYGSAGVLETLSGIHAATSIMGTVAAAATGIAAPAVITALSFANVIRQAKLLSRVSGITKTPEFRKFEGMRGVDSNYRIALKDWLKNKSSFHKWYLSSWVGLGLSAAGATTIAGLAIAGVVLAPVTLGLSAIPVALAALWVFAYGKWGSKFSINAEHGTQNIDRDFLLHASLGERYSRLNRQSIERTKLAEVHSNTQQKIFQRVSRSENLVQRFRWLVGQWFMPTAVTTGYRKVLQRAAKENNLAVREQLHAGMHQYENNIWSHLENHEIINRKADIAGALSLSLTAAQDLEVLQQQYKAAEGRDEPVKLEQLKVRVDSATAMKGNVDAYTNKLKADLVLVEARLKQAQKLVTQLNDTMPLRETRDLSKENQQAWYKLRLDFMEARGLENAFSRSKLAKLSKTLPGAIEVTYSERNWRSLWRKHVTGATVTPEQAPAYFTHARIDKLFARMWAESLPQQQAAEYSMLMQMGLDTIQGERKKAKVAAKVHAVEANSAASS